MNLSKPIETMTPVEFENAISRLTDQRLIAYYKKNWRYFNEVWYGSADGSEDTRVEMLEIIWAEMKTRGNV